MEHQTILLVNEDSKYASDWEWIAEKYDCKNDVYSFTNENFDELLFTIQDMKSLGKNIIAIM